MRSILSTITFMVILSLFACNSAEADKATTKSSTKATTSTPTTAQVNHYICPNQCVGGASDVAGNCSVCSSQLNHNAAFHSQKKDASQFVLPTPGSTPPPTTQAAQPSPAQNANGVYHYTCTKGCAGGAGTAQKCATCGQALTHNVGYHQ